MIFCRQIPLVIFKREKELARKLEFDGLFITEQPEDDDIKGQWDRLVLNTPYVDTKIQLYPIRCFLLNSVEIKYQTSIIILNTKVSLSIESFNSVFFF